MEKKKFTIALCAMAFALVAAIGGLIGVWAAANQTINSSFDVQYQVGANVAARLGLSYEASDGTKGTADAVVYGATEAVTPKTLSLGKVTFGPVEGVDTQITFVYSFENLSDTTAFTVNLTNKVVNDNTEVVSTTPDFADNTIAPLGTGTITIVVKVVNPDKAASYKTAEDAGITITLNAVAA